MPTTNLSTSTLDDSTIRSTFRRFGYSKATRIASALQGSVWRCSRHDAMDCAVIKVVDKSLHQQSLVIHNGVRYTVKEDILAESSILQYLSADPLCPSSIAKYVNSFESKGDYMLAMEDGGVHNLFDLVKKVHACIAAGSLSVAEWHKAAKHIFRQQLDAVEFMHGKNVCHFDLSLENCVTTEFGIQVQMDETSGQPASLHIGERAVDLKIVDFGLAHYFADDDFICTKFCGKKHYRSPEVVRASQSFDARKNDVFSLGVCLFMLVVGSAPWQRAHVDDACFHFIMNGKLEPLLKSWGSLNLVDSDILHLLRGIFKYEDERMSLADIKKCKWLE